MAKITLSGKFGEWLRQTSGGIALYMALMIPVLTGVIGMVIDVSQSYLMQERLSRALDAAALAVAGSASLETEEQMQARVDQFMAANYPVGKVGSPYDVDITLNGDFVTVSAKAKYNTSFLRVLGYDVIVRIAKTTVERKFKGVEVALVLDNTGSMSYKPAGASKTNIEALKTASSNFVKIMFNKAKKPEDVRIGLVPYANTVRVGLYGLGKIPDPLTGAAGSSYNNGSSFITLPAGKTIGNFYVGKSGTKISGSSWSFSNSNSDHDNSTKWYGCIIENKDGGYNINSATNDPYPNDVEDEYEGPWETYRYSNMTATQGSCATWHCTHGSTKTATGCSNPTRFVCDTYNYTYGISVTSDPNEGCPYANIMPLNSNKTNLLNGINTMQAHGNTQSNTGMIWGFRVISPEQPFTEGSEWGSKDWSKAIILMTDGDNTWDSDGYSEYWLSERNTGINKATLDSRLGEICETLKEDHDVTIYTIIFKSQTAVSNQTIQTYKDCATNEETTYFYAPTQTKLDEVFSQIAHELSNLHITE